MKVSVIICAAGKGKRAGFNKNKLLAPLYGAPALWHTLKKFNISLVDEVIVTYTKEDISEIEALCRPFGYKVCEGGQTRSQSVERALEKVSGEIVLIHDGARPFVTQKVIEDCIECVKANRSGICATVFTDTAATCEGGKLLSYPPRDRLYSLQTPQGFYTADIKEAYKQANGQTFTDDSAVYGQFIAPPHVFEGDKNNVKLTFKEDFLREYPRVTANLKERVGIGCDVHAFGKGKFVTLAGVKIECKNSLIAHSDGDVVYHAIIDALFSAAGLKDIGHAFPDTDEKYRGADSSELLKIAVEKVKIAGYVPVNVSVTVQAEHPKLKPHIDEMVENIAKICKINGSDVAVAAGTCEELGFVGEGLGIAAYAAVTLKPIKRIMPL